MKRLIYIALAMAILLVSCKDDYLETSPSTSVGETDLLKTPDLFDKYLNGVHNYIYYALYTYSWSGCDQMNFNLDYLSGDWVNTVPTINTDYFWWNNHRKPDGDYAYYYWDYFYTIIERCNRVIELTGDVKGASDEQRNTWLAEGHTIRAWAYHNLVQLYGKRFVKGEANDNIGVLLRLKVGFDNMPRATVAEVYAQINDDIKKGLDYFAKGNDLGRKDRIRPGTAYGIATRIALSQEEWAQAAVYADSAIVKSGASLQRGKALIDGFNDYNASEWMWGYTVNAAQRYGFYGLFAYLAYNFKGNSGFRYAADRTLLNRMADSDIRWKWFVCYDRGDQIPSDITAAAASVHFGGDYDGLPGFEIIGKPIKWYVKDPTVSTADKLSMRLAEMYYAKAEALAKSGDEAGAKLTLVNIMNTRDSLYTDATVAALTGDDLISEIMAHRAIDLWGEGHSFFDMKRTRKMPVRDSSANCQAYRDYAALLSTMVQTATDSLITYRAKLATALTKEDSTKILKNIDSWKADSASSVKLIPRCQARIKRYKERHVNMIKTLPKSLDDNVWEFVIPIDEIQGNKECKQNPM